MVINTGNGNDDRHIYDRVQVSKALISPTLIHVTYVGQDIMAMGLGNLYSITTLSQIGTFVISQRNPEIHHVQKCTCIRFLNPGQAPAISDNQQCYVITRQIY